MRHVFYQLYYHLVWATRGRQPTLVPELPPILFEGLHAKCLEFQCTRHEMNAVDDHVHVALEIPPSVAISTVVGEMKGLSSRTINRISPGSGYWQDGYGIVSYRKSDLAKIKAYIANQETHHRDGSVSPTMEKCDTVRER